MVIPSFSICIPYYQNENYLIEAVKSVADQTLHQLELIISCDQKISPETRGVLLQLVPECCIVENARRGLSGNWNHCVDLANGSHIVLLHGDDRLAPWYLESMALLIEETSAAAWFCGAHLIDATGMPTSTLADTVKPWLTPREEPILVSGDTGLSGLLRGCYIFCPTLCFSSEIIKSYLFSAEWEMTIDLELYCRLLSDGQRLAGTHKPCYYYRRHGSSQTARLTENTRRFQEEWALYRRLQSELDPATWPKSIQQARRRSIPRLHLAYDTAKRLITGRAGGLGQRLMMLFSTS